MQFLPKLKPGLKPIILIVSCTLTGFGINMLVGTTTPLWVLLIFSIIYSIEKWGKRATRNKAIGIPYRLFLNILVLSLLGYIIWFGVKLFSHNLQLSSLVSSLLFIGKLVFFVWLCRILSKNSWRLPSMKLTVFPLLAITIIFAFAGVQPFSTYKDNLVTIWSLPEIEPEPTLKPTPTPSEHKPIPVPEPTKTVSDFDEVVSKLSSPELLRSYMEENFSYDLEKYQRFLAGEDWGWDTPEEVFYGKKTNCGGYAIFALYCLLKNGYEYDNFEKNKSNATIMLGCWNSNVPNHRDVHTVLLYIEKGLFYTIDVVSKKGPFSTIEEAATASLPAWTVCYFYNTRPQITRTVERTGGEIRPTLKNPSWNQLLEFLKADDTDKHPYTFPSFVCEDFAKTLQESAKRAGWRCASLSVHLEGYPDWFNYGIPSSTGHALNAFETTDRGLVYIDVTRTPGPGPRDQDCIVDVQIGKEYSPKLIFPSGGRTSPYSMGTIVRISNLNW